MRSILLVLALCGSGVASAQFVWPKPEYTVPSPGVYEEDPFIIKYRREFFAVFKGDFARFEKAFLAIEKMVAKNPKDARAMVWRGNGKMIMAGRLLLTDRAKAKSMLAESSQDLDAAVALSPNDANIYMMRAATLYLYGQYFPKDWVDRSVWERLRDDCLKFIKFIGPDRMKKVSVHLRGEAYGELGIAYVNLGEKRRAIWAFQQVIDRNPGTEYADRAAKEIAKLKIAANG